MTSTEAVTSVVVHEAEWRLTTTGADLDRGALARRALDRFDDELGRYQQKPTVLRVVVGDTVYDHTGQRLDPVAPEPDRDSQVEQVRFLLADLRAAYPNPNPYDTAAVVIERLTRILEPEGTDL